MSPVLWIDEAPNQEEVPVLLSRIPDLTGRMAKCCKSLVPSSTDLAFFEFRGEGSKAAQEHCKHCGYYEVAHTVPIHKCKTFEPHGPYEHDLYYCGHGGWD